jgi:formylglycine-generating enzyme required for sulfatase activity
MRGMLILFLVCGATAALGGAGNCLDFDGVDDYVQIADHDDLDLVTNFTIECWFRADSLGGLQGLVSKYQAHGTHGYLLRLDGTELDFDEQDTSGLGLQTGVWYHVAAVTDGGTRSLYVNGINEAIDATGHNVKANSDPIRLGSDYGGRYLDGRMDEVRIWNIARSEAQIQATMNTPLAGDEPGLVAYYTFNQTSGTLLPDQTANDNDGTLVNMSDDDWVASDEIAGSAIHTGDSPQHYVWTSSPSPAWPYTNWATAAHMIQSAVDAADSDDTVWVTNGVYDTGGSVTPGYSLSNRVCITRPMTLRSVSGATDTFIVGAADPATTNGPAAVRCAYIVTNVVMDGFTLTNGHTHASGSSKDGDGGGVYCQKGGTLNNCTISGNSAEHSGGGVYCWIGGMLGNCTLSGNSANEGGGVYCSSGGILRNCTLSGNSADGGGGAYCSGGGILNNCTLSGNLANIRGGGVYCWDDGTLNNCTLSDNAAGQGGGVYFLWGGTLNNCLAWGNRASASGQDVYNTAGTIHHTCAGNGVTNGVDGCITNDPQFVDAAAGDYHLLPTSPCIDAGTNLAALVDDLDGNSRPFDGNSDGLAVHDMGAYEFTGMHHGNSPIHYVATNGVAIWPYTNWTTAARVIQDAVDAAGSGDSVLVSNGVYDTGGAVTPGYSLSNRVCITRAMTLRSVSGAEDTLIVGEADPSTINGPAAMRCVYITNNVAIEGFTLTNGHTHAAGAWRDLAGGGVFLLSGATVSNCTISGNSAEEYAGGVYCREGGTLNNCTISGNSGLDGGGVRCYKGGTLNNCNVSGNSADRGGGVYCYKGGTLNNCTLADNSVVGVWLEYGGLVRNSILWDNSPNDIQNGSADRLHHTCAGNGVTHGVNGCITNDPEFVDAAAGNYRLSAASPSIDAGNNDYVVGDTDLDGNPRIADGTVDMGAYEYVRVAFADWIAERIANPAARGFYDDPDGDGLCNGVEAYFGTDPGVFNAGLSDLSVNLFADSMSFQHPVNVTPPDNVVGAYQWSPDIYTWYDSGDGPAGGPTVVIGTTPHAGMALVTATASEPLDVCYVKLAVSLDSGSSGDPTEGMVLIPGGEFVMGDTFDEGDDDELPLHTNTISAFHMDETEVTKAKWDEVYDWATARGYGFDNAGSGKGTNHPVHTVNWYDCVKWANARSELAGFTPCYTNADGSVYTNGTFSGGCDWSADGYRLPTEAEWEKAARGGAANHRFPWDDSDEIQHARANYFSRDSYAYDTSPTRGDHPDYNSGGYPYTSPVGSFAPNGYGLYDMAGNLYEWCWDWYGGSYYGSSPGADPRGPASGSHRVGRGGNWSYDANGCRVAGRNGGSPGNEGNALGFRLVRSAP